MHPCALSHADFPAQVYLTVRYEWKADCTPEKSDVWWWWLGIFLFWVGEGGSDSDKMWKLQSSHKKELGKRPYIKGVSPQGEATA